MARSYDPLTFLPKADTVRACLKDAERRAAKLRILLRVAEDVQAQDADCVDGFESVESKE